MKRWIGTCLMVLVILIVSNTSTVYLPEGYEVDMHRGINIGNALDSPVDEDWGVDISTDFFDVIEQAGFDTVRLPVRFSDYISTAPEYLLDEVFLQELDGYINYALSLDLIVILDFHHFIGLSETASESDIEAYYAVWEQLSERYQKYPKELVFELLNEPHDALTSDIWNEMIAVSVDLIRETNKTRKLIISAPNYANVSSLSLLELPEDDHLIVTFHYYTPMEVTFQNNANHDYITGEAVAWTGTTQELATMECDFKLAYEFGQEHGVDIFLGEFGVVKEAPEEYREAWTRAVVEFADEYGIAYSYWELCSDFGIYEAESKTWNQQLLDVLRGEN